MTPTTSHLLSKLDTLKKLYVELLPMYNEINRMEAESDSCESSSIEEQLVAQDIKDAFNSLENAITSLEDYKQH